MIQLPRLGRLSLQRRDFSIAQASISAFSAPVSSASPDRTLLNCASGTCSEPSPRSRASPGGCSEPAAAPARGCRLRDLIRVPWRIARALSARCCLCARAASRPALRRAEGGARPTCAAPDCGWCLPRRGDPRVGRRDRRPAVAEMAGGPEPSVVSRLVCCQLTTCNSVREIWTCACRVSVSWPACPPPPVVTSQSMLQVDVAVTRYRPPAWLAEVRV